MLERAELSDLEIFAALSPEICIFELNPMEQKGINSIRAH